MNLQTNAHFYKINHAPPSSSMPLVKDYAIGRQWGQVSRHKAVAIWDRIIQGRRSKVPEVWPRSLVVGFPAALRLLLEHFKMAQLRGTLHCCAWSPKTQHLTTQLCPTQWYQAAEVGIGPNSGSHTAHQPCQLWFVFWFYKFQAPQIPGALAGGHGTKMDVHSLPCTARTPERALPRGDVTKASSVPRSPMFGAFLWLWLLTSQSPYCLTLLVDVPFPAG